MRTSTKLKFAYVALAAADTWLSGAGPRWGKVRVVTKPLLMPTLTASFVTDERARTSPLFASTVAAQGFGWGGDIGLLGEGSKSFMIGASSFGVGHLGYISGFRRIRGHGRLRDARRARALATTTVATAPVLGLAAGRQDPALGVAVSAYAALLTTMVAHGTHLDPAQTVSARACTAAGALSFLASDSILGTRKFLVKNPPAWMERAVMATYSAAQFMMMEGAARTR